MTYGDRGWGNIFSRSAILDQSNNFLDEHGSLAVVVSSTSVEKKLSPFVPSNPMSGIITGMFLEEDTADVRFEVSSSSGDEASSASAVTFHAHFLILKK